MVNCKDVVLKGLKIITDHIRDIVISNMYVTQIIINLIRRDYVSGTKF